jgi:surfeit locus 1 family protein
VADLAFLLRPRWILSHLFVLTLLALMVVAGFWQLSRLDQRRERNDEIRERAAAEVVPVQDLVDPDDDTSAVDAVRFHRVEATGTYDDGGTVVVRNRTFDGHAGVWVLTPLTLAGGEQVGVIRGFMGLTAEGDPDVPAAPAGEVTVEGILASPDRFDGTAPRDITPLVHQDGVLPAVVLATASDPVEEDWATTLHAVPLPDLDEGPHLAYAVQWFVFTTVGAIGYPLALRRIAQRREREAARDSAQQAEPVGG